MKLNRIGRITPSKNRHTFMHSFPPRASWEWPTTSVTNEEHVKLLTASIQRLGSNPRPWSYESLIIPAYTDYCNRYTKDQFCFLTREGFFFFSILFSKYHVHFPGKCQNGLFPFPPNTTYTFPESAEMVNLVFELKVWLHWFSTTSGTINNNVESYLPIKEVCPANDI